jgi:hypothetical protein
MAIDQRLTMVYTLYRYHFVEFSAFRHRSTTASRDAFSGWSKVAGDAWEES